ncbi:MAG: antitoxin component YwqK of YwqJK toxin-antitoxin module, partial [Planctomycetota bacterium]
TNGQKQSEGTYRDGKLQGRWNFWKRDGAVDSKNSGTYDTDKKIDG